MMSRFLDALKERVILGDGAYGTEFIRRGCLRDRPFDEMNLSRSHVVLDLHREYVAAGAELIRTNTFLANRFWLKEGVREVNLAGARLAREAAKGGFVAGVVGPPPKNAEGKLEAYMEQCRALADGGCDLLLLETFTDEADVPPAVTAAALTGLPVVGQMAIPDFTVAARVAVGLAVLGVNCVSAAEALVAAKQITQASTLPRSAFPSAGLPDQVASPEEFADGLRRLADSGVRLVGGCCGAGPDHLRAAAAVMGRGR